MMVHKLMQINEAMAYKAQFNSVTIGPCDGPEVPIEPTPRVPLPRDAKPWDHIRQ